MNLCNGDRIAQDYQLIRRLDSGGLARGGLAQVWLAVYLPKGERSVLQITPSLGTFETADPKTALWRLDQLLVAALLKEHRPPNVVRVDDIRWHIPAGPEPASTRQSPTLIIAQEFLDGQNLAELLANLPGLLPVRRVVQLFDELCEAVAELHKLGILHNDLKPNNVVILDDFKPWLIDFNISTLASGPTTQMLAGSSPYLAPERHARAPASVNTDLFSLGVLLYQCLTEKMPYPIKKQLLDPKFAPDPPSKHNPCVSPDLDTLVMRLIARDPTQRFGSVRELQTALHCIDVDGWQATRAGEIAQSLDQTTFHNLMAMAEIVGARGTSAELRMLAEQVHSVLETGDYETVIRMVSRIKLLRNRAIYQIDVLQRRVWLGRSHWIYGLFLLTYAVAATVVGHFPVGQAAWSRLPDFLAVGLITLVPFLALPTLRIIRRNAPRHYRNRLPFAVAFIGLVSVGLGWVCWRWIAPRGGWYVEPNNLLTGAFLLLQLAVAGLVIVVYSILPLVLVLTSRLLGPNFSQRRSIPALLAVGLLALAYLHTAEGFSSFVRVLLKLIGVIVLLAIPATLATSITAGYALEGEES